MKEEMTAFFNYNSYKSSYQQTKKDSISCFGKVKAFGYYEVVLLLTIYVANSSSLVTIDKKNVAQTRDVILTCTFSGSWDLDIDRVWFGSPNGKILIANGISSSSKYTENTTSASTTSTFSLTIHEYNHNDDGLYYCLYGFDLSTPLLLRAKDSACNKSDGFIQTENAILSKPTVLTCVTQNLKAIVQICDPMENIALNCLTPSGNNRTCFSGAIPNIFYFGGVTTWDTNIIIKSVLKENDGTWTCTHGAIPYELNITVLTLPSHIQETSSIKSVSMSEFTVETLTTEIECVYPVALMNWEYVHETNNITALGPFKRNCTDKGFTDGSCEDETAKTFICSFNLAFTRAANLPPGKYKVKASLVMEGEVKSTGISTILSTVITVPYLYDDCYCNIQLTVAITTMAVVSYAIIFISYICKKTEVHLKIMHQVVKYRVLEITMLAFTVLSLTLALVLLTWKQDKSCCIFTFSALGSVNIGSTTYTIFLFFGCRKRKGSNQPEKDVTVRRCSTSSILEPNEECQEENNSMELSPVTQNKHDELGKKALLISANPVQENDNDKFIKA